MALSEFELKRYNRQMMMDGWGVETQEKLKKSTVFVAGAGGLGSPVSIYLAVAGVGHMRICDFDSPDWTNLNRQILHDHTRIGINKAESAKMTLERLNPDIKVTALSTKITSETVDELVGDAQIIVDCMDNFPTRYILNECARRKSIPLVYGSIWGMDGMLSFIHSPETPCLRCIFPEAPPQETFPVVGATPGIIGSLQALETIKYLTGIGSNLKNYILFWNGRNQEFKKYRAYKDPDCPVCG
ncbi:MAG: HesA/MoeB/ThiF family protein [Nitrospirae bacterium]|nr:MAG: HesA/MoeB/ThiF family protein [Nitrospirota bacterium]